jgi:hypothetical protein
MNLETTAQKWQQIKDETDKKANTAERVGEAGLAILEILPIMFADYVPRSGTLENAPITGDLVFDGGRLAGKTVCYIEFDYYNINFYGDKYFGDSNTSNAFHCYDYLYVNMGATFYENESHYAELYFYGNESHYGELYFSSSGTIDIYAAIYIGSSNSFYNYADEYFYGDPKFYGNPTFDNYVTFNYTTYFNDNANFYGTTSLYTTTFNGDATFSGNITLGSSYDLYCYGGAYFDGSKQITFNSLPTITAANMDANNAGVFIQSGNVLKQMTKSEFQTWLNAA